MAYQYNEEDNIPFNPNNDDTDNNNTLIDHQDSIDISPLNEIVSDTDPVPPLVTKKYKKHTDDEHYLNTDDQDYTKD